MLALVAGGGFGTAGLRPVGVTLLVLGTGAIALVELAARGVRIGRDVPPGAVRAGTTADLTIRLAGRTVASRALHLLDWTVDAGAPPGFGRERRPPVRRGRSIDVVIGLTSLRRGEHTLRPPSVVLADPFGLVRVRRAARLSQMLLVLPRTVPVAVPFWEAGTRRSGQAAGVMRGRAELDGVRDYEPGDPLSLIHWAQTARRGRLQTKELHGESGRGRTVTILLDAADPRGDGDPDGPFEVAVSAAASLIDAVLGRGGMAGLVTAGAARAPLAPGTDAGTLRTELARLTPGDARRLPEVLSGLAVGAGAGTVVVVTAVGDPALGAAVSRARAAGTAVACVLVGPAGAAAPAVRRAGAWVATVAARDGLATALDAAVTRAA